MGCDIHCRVEVREERSAADEASALSEQIGKLNTELTQLRGPNHGYPHQEWADKRADAVGEEIDALQARLDSLFEATGTVESWRLLGAELNSSNNHWYGTANRETLMTMTDGQLLYALAWEGRSLDQVILDKEERRKAVREREPSPFDNVGFPRRADELAPFDPDKDDHHRTFREALSPAAQRELAEFNVRRDAYQADVAKVRDDWHKQIEAYRAAHPEEVDKFSGVPDEVSQDKIVAPRQQALLRDLLDVKLAPETREDIIATADGYFPYSDPDTDDPDEARASVSLDRAEGDPPFKTAEPYEGRNYAVFALLADVRNGDRHGQRIEPIADARGVPDDASPEGRAFMDSMGVDGHSHSYVTLAELEAVPFDQTVEISGVVSPAVYRRYRDEGITPTSWSGDIMGPSIRTFTPEGFEEWEKGGRPYIRNVSGRSWLDPSPRVDEDLLDRLVRDEVPLRRPGDDALRAGKPGMEGVEAPAHAAWGLSGIRGDATGEIVAELHGNENEIAQEAIAREAKRLETLREKYARGELDDTQFAEAIGKVLQEVDDAKRPPDLEIEPYVELHWHERLADYGMTPLREHTIPALRALADELGLEANAVRMIFFFDN